MDIETTKERRRKVSELVITVRSENTNAVGLHPVIYVQRNKLTVFLVLWTNGQPRGRKFTSRLR